MITHGSSSTIIQDQQLGSCQVTASSSAPLRHLQAGPCSPLLADADLAPQLQVLEASSNSVHLGYGFAPEASIMSNTTAASAGRRLHEHRILAEDPVSCSTRLHIQQGSCIGLHGLTRLPLQACEH